MDLLELIARADERALATSGIACLDRCLPPPGSGDDPEPLRALRTGCGSGTDWAGRLDAVYAALEGAAERDATTARVRMLLGAAPRDFGAVPLRTWADACSLLALDIHREFDVPAGGGVRTSGDCRAGGPPDRGPLVMGELRRQIHILESLAEPGDTAGGGAGLRRALDLSAEGRRVLRAVMSRHARGRAAPTA
ncbi:MAG TPA: hypothetical protein VN520_29680 [Streptomyces sp.]|uniref:hypothetical protein n=1 Tax=Streptomyces sp. TaxID=1931 RepID=UPI002C991F0C|nr:hypothetical protein [Streptomyces sp.]HWU10485.1 hypothetical protein [Streptomyces sp.]